MDNFLEFITLQQIKIFINIVEQGGFSAASIKLNMTQPAVSKAINKLEKDLDLILLERTTRKVELTPAGKSLYNSWRHLISDLEKGYISARAAQESMQYTLQIGLLNTAKPDKYFWAIQDAVEKKYPQIKLELRSEYMIELVERLQSGAYDCIMVPDFERFNIENRGLEWRWAAKSNAYVLMGKNHKLSNRKSLLLQDILNEHFLTLEDDDGCYAKDLKLRFKPYDIEPNITSYYKTAYDIQILFRHDQESLLIIDEYFAYSDKDKYVKIPLIDQENGIICAYNPLNSKLALSKFLSCM